ncbi:methylated-DNA--[protein]-cysteine S-methyltransferase [Roseateles sp. BYS87W]|uniref:Methylated-DNA--[protein]-cysteine S-methyltransferase n=1 Tax=Pelomonas baiyunensis TaxID=3299026 RepID=A0ABW7GY31_9BURK
MTEAALAGGLGACVFDTDLGPCGLVWSELGVVASRLPPVSWADLERRYPQAQPVQEANLPDAMQRVVAGVRDLLAGRRADLSDVVLDERDVPAFHRQVHALTRAIPQGETRTYGELAVALGQPGAARAVGRVQAENPFPPIVPCHRVMGASGALTGFSAPGGVVTKQRLLVLEARAVGQWAGEQPALF